MSLAEIVIIFFPMAFSNANRIILGTSSWSSRDWVGPFYPEGLKPADFIAFYAERFDAVEIDATYYRTPSAHTVDGWKERTPPDFIFAAKAPRVVTHEKVLVDALDDMRHFLDVMERLETRLGPILLQFPYFNKKMFPNAAPFLERLDNFLEQLPKHLRFAVEVRNKWWVQPALQNICRSHRVALTWVSHSWMPPATQWPIRTGGPSTDFAYIRFLGDRKAIEQITTHWDKTVIDRRDLLQNWIPVVKNLFEQDVQTFGFFNNHFGGHAPDTLRTFTQLYNQISLHEDP